MLTYERDGTRFEARRATDALVECHAATLCDWYNDPGNAAMMGGSGTMTRDDVIAFWRELREEGGIGFLSFVGGALVGDMDLRGLGGAAAEFAIMIGARDAQGRGLGRAFALMLHVHAFRDLGLDRLYVPPRSINDRVHRLNDWLGYAPDDSERARSFADEPGCVTSSIGAADFERRHPRAFEDVIVVAA